MSHYQDTDFRDFHVRFLNWNFQTVLKFSFYMIKIKKLPHMNQLGTTYQQQKQTPWMQQLNPSFSPAALHTAKIREFPCFSYQKYKYTHFSFLYSIWYLKKIVISTYFIIRGENETQKKEHWKKLNECILYICLIFYPHKAIEQKRRDNENIFFNIHKSA